jgi:hypothetical protein
MQASEGLFLKPLMQLFASTTLRVYDEMTNEPVLMPDNVQTVVTPETFKDVT